MRLRIRSPEDFWAGLLFVAIGLAALLVSRDYPVGSATRMGPGYFPTYVGLITAALGALVGVRALGVDGERIKSFAWRALLLLAAGFGAFGWGIERVGLVGSLASLIVLTAAAGREFRLREVAALAIVLVAASCAIFVYGLGLPFRLWW